MVFSFLKLIANRCDKPNTRTSKLDHINAGDPCIIEFNLGDAAAALVVKDILKLRPISTGTKKRPGSGPLYPASSGKPNTEAGTGRLPCGEWLARYVPRHDQGCTGRIVAYGVSAGLRRLRFP